MPVLKITRDLGERVYIGEGDNLVIVEVLRADRGQTSISITAPARVKVDREEIRDPKAAERQRQAYAKRRAEEADNRGNR